MVRLHVCVCVEEKKLVLHNGGKREAHEGENKQINNNKALADATPYAAAEHSPHRECDH